MKILMDDQETYKTKRKTKPDHNTFIIGIEKNIK